MSIFEQFESFAVVAIAAAAVLAIAFRALNRLLVWMDDRDWILIPNREAVKNADRQILKGMLEAQAIIEPAKRHTVRKKQDQQVRKAEDNQGDGTH